ncbi:transcription elongation factor S-II [Sanghuangporus baumii]|uniref:Transcription elongation factor S-II n=1 Tax=Sanghuangporus baumii TaxID=108892 RepID=A0A9Q5NEN5_SANBA|nr:transcription elongation factor S-II [Sanghuangporus baumii]
MSSQRDQLLAAAHAFCDAFAAQKPLDEILNHLANGEDTLCVEHGLQQLAPFLGRQFAGPDGVKRYFTIIADLLSYDNMIFSEYFADAETQMVSVKGTATFTWKDTGNSWDEVFTYRLQFNDQLKVKVYEVWADSGAAYLASRGELVGIVLYILHTYENIVTNPIKKE